MAAGFCFDGNGDDEDGGGDDDDGYDGDDGDDGDFGYHDLILLMDSYR